LSNVHYCIHKSVPLNPVLQVTYTYWGASVIKDYVMQKSQSDLHS